MTYQIAMTRLIQDREFLELLDHFVLHNLLTPKDAMRVLTEWIEGD